LNVITHAINYFNALSYLENKVDKFFFLIFQPPDEEPIYISVSGDEEEVPIKPPPIYHVLEDLRPKDESEQEAQDTNDE
jgi:hypothetical protein